MQKPYIFLSHISGVRKVTALDTPMSADECRAILLKAEPGNVYSVFTYRMNFKGKRWPVLFVVWAADSPIAREAIKQLTHRSLRKSLESSESKLRQRVASIERVKRWKRQKPERAKQHKLETKNRKSASDYATRPFVAIDFEGRDIPGYDIFIKGVRYPLHRAVLCGAGGQGVPFTWLERKDGARPFEILELLTSLPGINGHANFVSFSFSYDMAQFIAGASKQKIIDLAQPRTNAPTLFGGFAIKIRKGKWVRIWKLRDPKLPCVKENSVSFIQIDDIHGYYQMAFTEVCEPLMKRGLITKREFETICEGKGKRNQFEGWPMRKIKRYCGSELKAISIAAAQIRDGLLKRGIRVSSFSGPGEASARLMEKHNVFAHYPDDIDHETEEQDITRYAYFGANIQLIKQGHAPNTPIWIYDIASAYPYALTTLPSMKGGSWKTHRRLIDSIDKIEAFARDKNCLSMFKVEFRFRQWDENELPIPFFPFPYRKQDGYILFPSSGLGWYCQREVMAAIKWAKHYRCAVDAPGCYFVVHECREFIPANDIKPFAFLLSEYADRKAADAAGHSDVGQAIKSTMNGIAGKIMQSVGEGGVRPKTANPFYSAAITAEIRAQLIEAALLDPLRIIGFQTDSILSTAPLALERLHMGGKHDAPLGAWTLKGKYPGGFFLQAGIYDINDGSGHQEKARGFKPHHFAARENFHDVMLNDVLPEWRKPRNLRPKITIKERKYVTVHDAAVSTSLVPVVGRWCDIERSYGVNDLGKRFAHDLATHPLARQWAWLFISDAPREINEAWIDTLQKILPDWTREQIAECYKSGEAFRCRGLIPSIPEQNEMPGKMSRKYEQKWHKQKIKKALEAQREMEDLMKGFS
jgi:hypothetical protein